ncbi:hypothetical protein D3C73_1595170 [compost metagenome]
MVADQIRDQINHHNGDRQEIQVQIKINDQVTRQQGAAQAGNVSQRVEARLQPGVVVNGEHVPEREKAGDKGGGAKVEGNEIVP